MRVGLVQLTVGDDPAVNLVQTIALVRAAVAGGAELVLTPECTNGLSSSREHQRKPALEAYTLDGGHQLTDQGM